MSLNLVCSHIEVDSFESDLWSNAKLMIKAIRGDEVVVGVLTPTVYAQAGAGFFRIKWKKKIPPTKAYIKKIGVKGETIANAKFEMSYTKDFSDSNQKWSYTTGSDGLTEKDEWNVIGKTVYVREISVPKPYIKTNEVKTFVVGSSPMIKLIFINKKAPERLKGKLKIAKVGDVLEKYTEEKVTVKGKDYVVKKPKFKKSYIKGATFYIKQNGKVIKTVTSKTDLLEIVLPLGKYQVVEKQAPDGYIKSEKIYDVDLTKNQDIKTLEIKNEREKVKLNLTKSFEKGIFKKETWAVFGLFTKEKQNGLEKDTLIEVLDFDKENSSKEFKNTIKGKYYIKELNNSSGYRKYEKTYDIDFSFEKVASKTIINKLKRGGIQILKVDKNNKEIKLSSVEFKLLANNEKRTEIATKTTNKDGIATFENLELGEYILIETKTKEGYILDTKEKIIRVKEDNKITMETIENQPTKVVISKVGKDNPEKQLEGAEFEIIEVEDEEKEKKSTEISNKKEINPKVLSLLDDKFKFLLKKENLLKEDLEKLL